MAKPRQKRQSKTPPGAVPVYRADGRAVIGRVVGNVFYKRLRSTIHLLRIPPAWACDRAALDAAVAAGATRIEIFDRDTGATYAADISDFYSHGVKVGRGHGDQLGLPLGRWQVTGGRVTTAWPGLDQSAAGPVQLGLF